MRRLKLIIIIAFLTLSFPSVIFAQTVNIESTDIFQLVAPFDATTLRGESQVSFRAYDNNQPEVAYQVKLLDAGCRNDYGLIASGSAPSLQDKFTTISWNTNGPLVNRSDVENGNYCMQVCVNLSIRSQPNAVCSTRFITIDNRNNKSPIFTSTPIGTLKVTDKAGFQLRASDDNRDNLSFGLIAGPTFVQVDKDGKVSISAANQAAGIYEVIISVSDGVNAPVEHRFNLQVGSENVFVSEQNGSNKPSEFIIVNPQKGAIYAGNSNNTIKWVISDADGIRELKIQYSSDGKTWNNIVGLNGQGQQTNDSNLNWDVSRIAAGNYLMKFIVIDKLGVSAEKISERFIIGSVNNSVNTSVPLIINIRPEDTSEITNRRPEIRGSFVPSYRFSMNVSSFKMLLDGNDITQICQVDATGFNCKLTTDLNLGKHLLKVSLKDTSGKDAIRDWVFTISSNAPTPTVTSTVTTTTTTTAETPVSNSFDIPRFTTLLLLAICVIAFVLIVLPWILYLIWKRRGDRDEIIVTPKNNNDVTIRVEYPPQPIAVANYMPAEPIVTPPAPVINLITQPVAAPPAPAPIVETKIPEPVAEVKRAASSTAGATPDWLKAKKIEVADSKDITSFGYGVKADE